MWWADLGDDLIDTVWSVMAAEHKCDDKGQARVVSKSGNSGRLFGKWI